MCVLVINHHLFLFHPFLCVLDLNELDECKTTRGTYSKAGEPTQNRVNLCNKKLSKYNNNHLSFAVLRLVLSYNKKVRRRFQEKGLVGGGGEYPLVSFSQEAETTI